MIRSGSLRHRIRIERRELTQNPMTGEMIPEWVTEEDNVPAEIAALSVRDFIAAQAAQSEVSVRIKIRYRDWVLPTMRIVHRDKIYSILGIMPDPDSGLEYLTLPCKVGVRND